MEEKKCKKCKRLLTNPLSTLCFDCWYNSKSNNTKPAKVPGCYIYLWFKPYETVPFYVGKGSNERAWAYHRIGNNVAECQKIWDSNPGCKVQIVKTGLTDQEAYTIEQILIQIYRDIGVVLANAS